jgi:hypothetical protein
MKYPLNTMLGDVDPRDQEELIPSLLIMSDPEATLGDYFNLFEECVGEPRSTSRAYKLLVQEEHVECTTSFQFLVGLGQPLPHTSR